MPALRKPLPEGTVSFLYHITLLDNRVGLESHPHDPAKVRCLVCSPITSDQTQLPVKYMNRTSAMKHLSSESHRIQVQAQEQKIRERTESNRIFQQTYHGFTLLGNQDFRLSQAAPRPSMFDDPLNSSSNTLQGNDMAQPLYSWDDEMIPTLHEHPVDLSGADEQDNLARQFVAMVAHAQHIDEFGDDEDEDCISDTFRALGKS